MGGQQQKQGFRPSKMPETGLFRRHDGWLQGPVPFFPLG